AAAGTVRDKNVTRGGASWTDPVSAWVRLTKVNGRVFLSAEDATQGRELWKSDGTAAGTVLVKDIYSGNASSSPQNLTNVNGTLFFTADDGTHGQELWQSNGTTAGTILVKDIYPGSGGYFFSPPISALTNLNGTLLF